MICRWRFFILIFLSIFLQISHAESTSSTNKVLVISDIHFSPFAGCRNNAQVCPIVQKLNKAEVNQWPQILAEYSPKALPDNGQATNYTLIRSMLTQLKIQKPATVLILGDFLAHLYHRQYLLYSQDYNQNDYNAFVKKTLQFLTNSIQDALPKESFIYPVVGNNDTYGDKSCSHNDYCSIANGIFFQDVAKLWAPVIKDDINSFTKTFVHGGYYQVTLPRNNNHIIVLNTVFFSPKSQGENLNKAAQQQLSWLSNQLQMIAARKEKTWIIFHIPPGIDSFATAKKLFQTIVPFWQPAYSQIFLSLINQYNNIIMGVLSGHTHFEGSLILSETQAKNTIVDSFVPSISPVLGNNPGYKIFILDKDNFKLEQLSTYYLDLKKQADGQDTWQQKS